MLVSTMALLEAARSGGYAIGAFNVYNLEGACAVAAAAEAERAPALLQIHPAALGHGGLPLVSLCLTAAREAAVPMALHLDHGSSPELVRGALSAGFTSIMVDGSQLDHHENLALTRDLTALAHARGVPVEAELGRLSGTEDGLTVADYESRLTDPTQAADFVAQTGVDALAVCIGNVHGPYRGEPRLDFDRLAAIRQAVSVPLVLHGASGLPAGAVRTAIELGVCKFNVNTELREAHVRALGLAFHRTEAPDLLGLMQNAAAAMQTVVAEKLSLFGASGKA